MDAIAMLQAAVALFGVAALGGLVMAGVRFSRKVNPPVWLSMLHGLLAAGGLTLVAYAALVAGVSSRAQIALVLLLLAAAGGVTLALGYQWKQRLLPATIVVGHALAAVAGFALLFLAAYR
jgi:hypothetical protein